MKLCVKNLLVKLNYRKTTDSEPPNMILDLPSQAESIPLVLQMSNHKPHPVSARQALLLTFKNVQNKYGIHAHIFRKTISNDIYIAL